MEELFSRLYSKGFDEFSKELKKYLTSSKKVFIVTSNPETFMFSEKDEKVKELLEDKNTILVPDGIGIVKSANMLGFKINERVTGVDIASKLLDLGNELNKSVYFFGAKEEIVSDLVKICKQRYHNLNVVGYSNGYVDNKDEVFDNILKLKPDIVLVALGIPHQEKLIYKHLNKFKKGIFVGVGGSFDVMSGHKKRAPRIFIKTNTEWLYRIIKEPNRLKRFYNSNVKFIFKVRKLKANRR